MSLNKFTETKIGKVLGLKIGCVELDCDNLSANGNNFPTDLGSADYVLRTDGAGNTSWGPDTAGGAGVIYNGTPPTTAGQLAKISGIDGKSIEQSVISEVGGNIDIGGGNITNVNLVDGFDLPTEFSGKVSRSGDSMTGNLDMLNNDLIQVRALLGDQLGTELSLKPYFGSSNAITLLRDETIIEVNAGTGSIDLRGTSGINSFTDLDMKNNDIKNVTNINGSAYPPTPASDPTKLSIDGSIAMTGALDLDNNAINNAGFINGFAGTSAIQTGFNSVNFDIKTQNKLRIEETKNITRQNIVPDIDSTHDLGETGLRFLNVWTDNINGSAYPPTSGDVSYTGTAPTVSGQLVLMNSTDGKEIRQSTLTESTLNGKVDKSGDTMTGNLNMSGSSVTETSQVRGVTAGSLRLRNSTDTRNIDISQTDITVNTSTDEFIINSLGGMRLGTSTNIIPNTASTLGDVSNFFNSAFLGATTTSSVRARTVGTNELLFLNDNNTQVMKLLPNTSGAVLEFSGGAKMRSQNIEPVTNNTLNIGTSALRYNNIFTSNINPTTVGVPLVLGNTTDRVDIKSSTIRFDGAVVSASYVPQVTQRVICNGTVAVNAPVTQSLVVDFRVVQIGTADPDDTCVIGYAVDAGTVGSEIRIAGARLVTCQLDGVVGAGRRDPVEKSDSLAGRVQQSAVSAGTFGCSAETVGINSLVRVWLKTNESF